MRWGFLPLRNGLLFVQVAMAVQALVILRLVAIDTPAVLGLLGSWLLLMVGLFVGVRSRTR